jgi:hypothetical protein
VCGDTLEPGRTPNHLTVPCSGTKSLSQTTRSPSFSGGDFGGSIGCIVSMGGENGQGGECGVEIIVLNGIFGLMLSTLLPISVQKSKHRPIVYLLDRLYIKTVYIKEKKFDNVTILI